MQTVTKSDQSPFTKLWQSCSDPNPKISPIAIFAFYSLNYSHAARLQDNSRLKSHIKVETRRKLKQYSLWMVDDDRGESSSENKNFKKVRGWQFLTMKAAETLSIVCLPPEEHIS